MSSPTKSKEKKILMPEDIYLKTRYCKVIAVAKRAKSLLRKSREKGIPVAELALVHSNAKKPVTIALEEFQQGKIKLSITKEPNSIALSNKEKVDPLPLPE